jgi:HEAT repeat protein
MVAAVSKTMRFLAVLAAVLGVSAPSFASALVITSEPNGNLAIKDGEHVLARLAPKTTKDQRGPATVKSVTSAGHNLVEVRLPVLGDPPTRQEVWIGERIGAAASVLWSGMVGARDADGETTLDVQASAEGVEQFQTARRLSRCDGQPVRLFRKRWNFASHKFVPAAADLPARASATVEARRGGAPTGKSSSGFFFSAASSSPGAESDAARLKPPAAVNDDNPDTVWMSDGEAPGQTLTARSSAGFPIIGVRLLPGDTRTEKSYRASAKPRHVTLVFGKDEQNVDVELLEDADGGGKRYREPFWIALPRPVVSTCVTVIVRDASNYKAPMALADMAVLTELDGPNAADRLVEDLGHANRCAARLPLLIPLGATALAKVAAAIPKTPPGMGRECLVEALAELLASGEKSGPKIAAALVATLDHASDQEDKTILALLPTMAGVSVPAIAAVLVDEKRSDDDRARAARVLATMKGSEATLALLANVGRGSSALRKSMRAAASTAKAPAEAAALEALKNTPAVEHERRADLLAIVAALAEGEPTFRSAVLLALQNALHSDASFEERARAIAGLGALHDPAAVTALINVRTHAGDGVLRSLATNELASSSGADVLPSLRDALSDADPRARETAAESLGRKHDQDAAKRLVDGAKQEPWPSVRRAEIEALGDLCVAEGNALLIRAFERDSEEVRQAALVGIARCYGPKAIGTLLRTLGRQAESADLRSLAARLLAQRKDVRLVPGLKEVLARLLRESEADFSLEAVVADVAMALADLRTPEAISALISLLSDPRVSTKRIAIDALAMICDPTQGAAALHAAAGNKDDAVSIPAGAAERTCNDRLSKDVK